MSSIGTRATGSFVSQHFEGLLKLPGMMMTEPGKREAAEREEIMVQFLRGYFKEQNAPEWDKFLERYLLSVR